MSPNRDQPAVATAAPAMEVLAVRGAFATRRSDRLAGEEPLQIRAAGPGGLPMVGADNAVIDEQADVAVTMRTPGNEEELAAGFLISEGLASPDEIALATFAFADPSTHSQPHDEILVRLPQGIHRDRLAPRTTIATASCGICGKASIDDVVARCAPLPGGPRIGRSVLVGLPDAMRSGQAVFERTGGLHACALFDVAGSLLSVREDVGRHNALDKLIGAAALAGELPLGNRILLVSGRVSFEVAQKAAVVGIPILAAISAPTDLAVETARRLGMTLVGFLRGDGFNVYAGEERIGLDR